MALLINFTTEFIVANKALLVSILALFVSLLSFANSRRSLKLSEKVTNEANKLKASEQRADILDIIDRKNAKIGNLQAVLGEKYYLLSNNPQLSKIFPGEMERITSNITCLNNLKAQYGSERKTVESFDDKVSIPFNLYILADSKRLLIHIEEDIVKEERGLKLLRDELARIDKG